jgi:hypothetical protein
LRTPLARLLALIEGATLPGGDPAAALEQMRSEVELMDELIDDVLFLSELETGREVVSLGSTEAAPLLREIISELAERSERAGVELRVEIEDETLELPLRARMLRIVVQNLVENALRHAGEGASCVLVLRRERTMAPASTARTWSACSSASIGPIVPAPRGGAGSGSRSSSTWSRRPEGKSRPTAHRPRASRFAASFRSRPAYEWILRTSARSAF